MNIEDLLIPARHIDIFYAVIAQNGGIKEMKYKQEVKVSQEAFVELVIRLGGAHADTEEALSKPVQGVHSSENEKNEHESVPEVPSFIKNHEINEFISPKNEEPTKNESFDTLLNESPAQGSLFELKEIDNQILDIGLPEVLIEDWRKSEKNLVRAIFDHKGTSLKTVAERYGGRSASANIANFMAKTDSELSRMRKSTATRLANALEVPVEWILAVRHAK